MARARRRSTVRSTWRFIGGALLIALLTTVAVSTAAIEGIGTIADALSKGQLVTSPDLTPPQAGKPQTIMIVGSDKRYNSRDLADREDPPHTDTILLVHLDPKAGAISVLSVPRDLVVPKFTFRGIPFTNEKINFAYTAGVAYGHSTRAGDELALAVVKRALDNITINDFIDLNFDTFLKVVAKLGCVYVDVDHRFYHENYPGEPSDENYSDIDVHPGYQPLCYQGALSYVRYRHDDNTFARDAREQDFLRDAKDQLSVTELLTNYSSIVNEFAGSINTNIRGSIPVARLADLVAETLSGPVRQVQFPDEPVQVETTDGIQDDQTATPRQIATIVTKFLSSSPTLSVLPPGQSRSGPSGSGHGGSSPARHASTPSRHHVQTVVPGDDLIATPSTTTASALQLATSVPFPVELPSLTYESTEQPDGPWDYYGYQLRGTDGHEYSAYRITWQDTDVGAGAYYGIEGTNWTDPPLFKYADVRYYGGKRYLEVGNGHKIQEIGWIDGADLYWIANTIFDNLSDPQMIQLAQSSRSIG